MSSIRVISPSVLSRDTIIFCGQGPQLDATGFTYFCRSLEIFTNLYIKKHFITSCMNTQLQQQRQHHHVQCNALSSHSYCEQCSMLKIIAVKQSFISTSLNCTTKEEAEPILFRNVVMHKKKQKFAKLSPYK